MGPCSSPKSRTRLRDWTELRSCQSSTFIRTKISYKKKPPKHSKNVSTSSGAFSFYFEVVSEHVCVCMLGKIGSQRPDYYISDLKYVWAQGRKRHTHTCTLTHTSPPPAAALLFPTGLSIIFLVINILFCSCTAVQFDSPRSKYFQIIATKGSWFSHFIAKHLSAGSSFRN